MLQVGIVGAGIAGLSAAIALSRAGHHVEIFEKSRFTYETGAAITVGPNGTRILTRWGFDLEKAGAVDCERTTRVRATTLEFVSEANFDHIQQTYGDRWCFFHRADLHDGLRILTELSNNKIKTHLGDAVADVDPDAGTIRLTNGTEIAKDLIVVADGAHSGFITKFIGRTPSVNISPLSVYRFLLPFGKLAAYPETEKFFKVRTHGSTTFYQAEVGRPGPLLVTYPCRSANVVYCGVLHPSKPGEKDLQGWTSPATVEDVMSVIGKFHPAIQAICREANDIKVYTLTSRDPIETFTKGRAIVIGDAGHLMLPTHGQGACMALEDAMALEVLFANVSKLEDVHRALDMYNKLRIPRVSAVQTMSNKMKAGMEKAMLDEVKTYYDGPIPGPEAGTLSAPYNDFFFKYDVAKEAEKFRGSTSEY